MFKSLFVVGFFLLSFGARADSYSDRQEAIQKKVFEDMHNNEVQFARESNQRMLDGANFYVQAKRTEIQPGTMHCPVRRDMYWYGFNTPSDDDPYSSIQYQDCEFNTATNEACYVGEAYQWPVYISCIDGQQVKTGYSVFANGKVALYKSGDSAIKPSGSARKHSPVKKMRHHGKV